MNENSAARAGSTEVTHYHWDNMPWEQVNDWMKRRMITADRTMVTQIFLGKGGVVPEHYHENEQITYVVQGAMKFFIEGREIIVGPGDVLTIPSNVPHKAEVLEDTLEFDIFTPPREDWLRGTDEYLKQAPPVGEASGTA